MSEKLKLGIIERGKRISVDVVFRRENLNPISLRTVFGFFFCTVEFSILNLEEFKEWTLTKFRSNFANGHDKNSFCIKIFLNDGFGCQEVQFSKNQQMGLKVKIGTAKRLTRQKALELIKSGNIRYFDSETDTGFAVGNLLA
jgi:hypothetical protein